MAQESKSPLSTTELPIADESTLPSFFSTLGAVLPNDVILIRIKNKPTYASYQLMVEGVGQSRGILCFSTHSIASRITKALFPANDFIMEDHTLDSAHAIAKEKSPKINCLLLFDNPQKPIVHYVN